MAVRRQTSGCRPQVVISTWPRCQVLPASSKDQPPCSLYPVSLHPSASPEQANRDRPSLHDGKGDIVANHPADVGGSVRATSRTHLGAGRILSWAGIFQILPWHGFAFRSREMSTACGFATVDGGHLPLGDRSESVRFWRDQDVNQGFSNSRKRKFSVILQYYQWVRVSGQKYFSNRGSWVLTGNWDQGMFGIDAHFCSFLRIASKSLTRHMVCREALT